MKTFVVELQNGDTVEVTAVRVESVGHEGRWVQFSDGDGVVRWFSTSDVVGITRKDA